MIGGSGFFGKSILDAYNRGLLDSWEIRSIKIIARQASYLRKTDPSLIGPNIELIDQDISSCKILPPANYVIHAAASTDATRYVSMAKEEKENILSATLNYCQLAKEFHKESKIVYVSSGAVYGKQPANVNKIAENYDFGLIENLEPVKQNYAAAKRDGEKYVQALGALGYKVSIARCFSFIGHYLPLNQHFAIGNFIRDGLKGKSIVVNARHQVIRSYMYADDLVIWLMTIANIGNSACPIYNVGSSEIIEIRELAKMIAEKFNVEVITHPTLIQSQVDRYIPSIEKAITQLNISLKYNLDSALNLTIKSFLKF
ncbi:NAD(P)-dependent oxidoreductase [Polynucleobacter sp. HIN8]|nr:NAD(P)-dependent oxidoreductase [Polynucleobacter sp. HIN8]